MDAIFWTALGSMIAAIVASIALYLSIRERQRNIENFEDQQQNLQNQFEEQQKFLQRQQFETTFFNMMKLQQELTDGIEFNDIQGRIIFYRFFEQMELFLNSDEIERIDNCRNIITKYGIKGYEDINQLPIFDHYFRHLYNIYKFIDDANFLDDNTEYIDERYKYARIVRATLSPYELILLFYNGLSVYGKGFKKYMEKYCIFNNIKEDLLATSPLRRNFKPSDPIGSDYYHLQTDEKNIEDKYYKSAFEKDLSLFKYK